MNRITLGALALVGPMSVTPVAMAQETRQVPPPLHYAVHHVSTPPAMDGRLDDPAWSKAEWTSDFVDILGGSAPTPKYKTRVKMLWDDKNLYIAAELEEPNVHAKLTEHDSVIFHDDDFEFFIKPVVDGESYYEFEMNALNTTWDLFLNKPYRFGGKADNSWEATGLKSAVHVNGTLNQPDDTDRGWTLEIALPLNSFASRQQVTLPGNGTTWRINFSRVEWLPGHEHEENWVWSPQGVVNMHVPEQWGYLDFRK
ncbi:carbohydrate-binding family 9-like protein [Terriglobus aquaticus]|uniref:Carbohydrate-binding family 9-like protein n=1 Tax=Terriglobus aquaticus TaxID=940139 RepID=A0ABW9KS22_9BACT|nr:carbohydrate-binding family 9-like protein [Terriglobus aquaticus]